MKIPNNTKHTKIKQKLHAHTPKQTTPPQKKSAKSKTKEKHGSPLLFLPIIPWPALKCG